MVNSAEGQTVDLFVGPSSLVPFDVGGLKPDRDVGEPEIVSADSALPFICSKHALAKI